MDRSHESIVAAAAAMRTKVYADLVADGAYGLDLAHSYTFGIFMDLARQDVVIESACRDPDYGIQMMDTDGNIYKAEPRSHKAEKI